MKQTTPSVAKLARDGFAIVRSIINRTTRLKLLDQLGPVDGAGRRGLLQIPAIAKLARSAALMRLVRSSLPGEPLPVRAIYFDKSPSQNWAVAWHQDLALALRGSEGAPGFGPWSVKEGVHHAFAPADCLEKMLTLRLHLDDCDESNGALRVIPGSHTRGRIAGADIASLRNELGETTCAVPAGGVLLLRPLLLHASGRSKSAGHRRVLHIEYASFTLPDELQWHEAA